MTPDPAVSPVVARSPEPLATIEKWERLAKNNFTPYWTGVVAICQEVRAALVPRPEPRAQEPPKWTHELPWAARSAIIAAGEFGLEPTMQPVIDELRRRMKAATATDSSHVAAVITRLMTFVQHTSACLGARTCRECECGAAKAIDDAKNIACSLAAVLSASAPSLEPDEDEGFRFPPLKHGEPIPGKLGERRERPPFHLETDAASARSRPLLELIAKLDELADALDHARLEVREVYVRDAEAGRTCREAATRLRALVLARDPQEP